MNIKGTVKAVLNVESGTSKSGNAWQKQTFVITTEGQYPKDVAFTLFGEDKVKLCPKVGESVDVHFDVASREWQGRYFTEATAYRVDRPSQQASAPVPSTPAANDNGDLPF